jgi:hypothetical protein
LLAQVLQLLFESFGSPDWVLRTHVVTKNSVRLSRP